MNQAVFLFIQECGLFAIFFTAPDKDYKDME